MLYKTVEQRLVFHFFSLGLILSYVCCILVSVFEKPGMLLLYSLFQENWEAEFSTSNYSVLAKRSLSHLNCLLSVLHPNVSWSICKYGFTVPGKLGNSHICGEVQKQPIGTWKCQCEEEVTILVLKLNWRAKIRWKRDTCISRVLKFSRKYDKKIALGANSTSKASS